MIVHYLHAFRSGRCPSKTQPVLIINAHTVPARAIAPQCLKPVAWRRAQKLQCFRRIKLCQLSHGNVRDT